MIYLQNFYNFNSELKITEILKTTFSFVIPKVLSKFKGYFESYKKIPWSRLLSPILSFSTSGSSIQYVRKIFSKKLKSLTPWWGNKCYSFGKFFNRNAKLLYIFMVKKWLSVFEHFVGLALKGLIWIFRLHTWVLFALFLFFYRSQKFYWKPTTCKNQLNSSVRKGLFNEMLTSKNRG